MLLADWYIFKAFYQRKEELDNLYTTKIIQL